MTTLTVIRKHAALLRHARIRSKRWGATRTDPIEVVDRSRAQSLLAGSTYRGGSTNPGTLTLEQARDVLAWATTSSL